MRENRVVEVAVCDDCREDIDPRTLPYGKSYLCTVCGAESCGYCHRQLLIYQGRRERYKSGVEYNQIKEPPIKLNGKGVCEKCFFRIIDIINTLPSESGAEEDDV